VSDDTPRVGARPDGVGSLSVTRNPEAK